MSFEDLITPEQVDAARGIEEEHVRPPGDPTVGLTANRKVVFLSSFTKSTWGAACIIKVTREGWDYWYPVQDGDIDVALQQRALMLKEARKAKKKKPTPLFDGDVKNNEGDHSWN